MPGQIGYALGANYGETNLPLQLQQIPPTLMRKPCVKYHYLNWRKVNFDVLNSDETGSSSSSLESSMLCSNFDVSITNITVADDIDKTSSLGSLTNNEFAIIDSSTCWLNCVIIHQAQVLLNPNIEGFQRTTLGPVKNFDVIGGEFIQILHTSGNHWVCELHWLSERAC